MRVAIDAVGIREGGGAAILEQLLLSLPQAKPDWEWCVWVLPPAQRRFADPPVPGSVCIEHVHSATSAWGRTRWLTVDLPRRAAQYRADVVFAFANVACLRPVVPQVAYCQQALAFAAQQRHRPKRIFQRALILAGLRRSEAAIVQTVLMKEYIAAALPGSESHVFVIPSAFAPPRESSSVREHLHHLTEGVDGPLLFYPAHALAHKNHAMLVDAVKRIVAVYPKTRLLLTVDRAPSRHDQHVTVATEIHACVERAGLGETVISLGTLTRDEVLFTLANSTVMVFPSLVESFGLPLVEAMFAGCPVVAADRPYAREVLGSNGVYADPCNADAFAAAILDVLGDPARQDSLRLDAGRCRARFSPGAVARQIAEILEAAAGKRQHGRF